MTAAGATTHGCPAPKKPLLPACFASNHSPVAPFQKGSISLFRVTGIQVDLHWSWFLAAVYFVSELHRPGQPLFYAVAAYLSLFLIVLLHEFGHSFACRQVGGRAQHIVLWPLGGIAFVQPPHRPGAMLWSIAAGPLVNVVLVPVTYAFMHWAARSDLALTSPGLPDLAETIFGINLVLLVFNLIPVYPLDGGQIMQSMLWFAFGYGRSLYIASILGFIGVPCLVAYSWYTNPGSVWPILIAVFLGSRCWQSFKLARERMKFERRPRDRAHACPACGASPLQGLAITCAGCGQPFDPYATTGVCPRCGAVHPDIRCLDCGEMRPIVDWRR